MSIDIHIIPNMLLVTGCPKVVNLYSRQSRYYFKCLVVGRGGGLFSPCFVMYVKYFVFFLVLQSSPRGRDSWLLYLIVF